MVIAELTTVEALAKASRVVSGYVVCVGCESGLCQLLATCVGKLFNVGASISSFIK